MKEISYTYKQQCHYAIYINIYIGCLILNDVIDYLENKTFFGEKNGSYKSYRKTDAVIVNMTLNKTLLRLGHIKLWNCLMEILKLTMYILVVDLERS